MKDLSFQVERVEVYARLCSNGAGKTSTLEVVEGHRTGTTRVSRFSGGEKRRLDVATTVYGQPELVFLDEPATELDIQIRDAHLNNPERNPPCSPWLTASPPRSSATGPC